MTNGLPEIPADVKQKQKNTLENTNDRNSSNQTEEIRALLDEILHHQNAILSPEIALKKANLLEPYLKKITRACFGYIYTVLLILLAQAYNFCGFKLSDTILSILVGGSVLNLFGLCTAIATGLMKNN